MAVGSLTLSHTHHTKLKGEVASESLCPGRGPVSKQQALCSSSVLGVSEGCRTGILMCAHTSLV